MNDQEAYEYIRVYFHRVFAERDVSALDEYLHPDYWDDDIGEPGISHIDDSKRFLYNLFKQHPYINVNVEKAMCIENIITAYLQWNDLRDGRSEVIRRGVAIFILSGNQIAKRHTYFFCNNDTAYFNT